VCEHLLVVARELGLNTAEPTTLVIDLNCAFASIEQQHDPTLRGRPLAIAAYATDAATIVSSSREARDLGIKTGMRVYEGRAIYPRLVVMEPNPPRYRAVSDQLIEILEHHSPDVLRMSIDEASLNLAGTPDLVKLGPEGVGRRLEQDVPGCVHHRRDQQQEDDRRRQSGPPGRHGRGSAVGRLPSAISLRIRRWVSTMLAAEPRPRAMKAAVQRPVVVRPAVAATRVPPAASSRNQPRTRRIPSPTRINWKRALGRASRLSSRTFATSRPTRSRAERVAPAAGQLGAGGPRRSSGKRASWAAGSWSVAQTARGGAWM